MKEALERMERKVKELELRKGTIAVRAQQAKAGGGVEALGAKGTGPSAFDEFRRMEDKVETASTRCRRSVRSNPCSTIAAPPVCPSGGRG